MLIWRVSCAIIWDNYGQEKTKMVDYPIRTLCFLNGGGGTKQKVCLKGKKLILMQNDTTLLRQVLGINIKLHVQYSTVIKSSMLGPTVIGLCQWTTNVCWIFKSELKVKTSWACFPDPSASKSINNGGCYINHSSIT